jgi:hypothetical protein
MGQITADSLMSLEQYAKNRKEFRTRVLAHKKHRTVRLGQNLTLVFEDELTMRYQIQEMLRVERIFEADGIREELDAYNPLVPDGSNWKATMLIEYPDSEERRLALSRLIGIEDRVWVEVQGQPRIYAIADEDIDRENSDKTSAVHFLRFELPAPAKQALRAGAALSFGVDHPDYSESIEKAEAATVNCLLKDLVF